MVYDLPANAAQQFGSVMHYSLTAHCTTWFIKHFNACNSLDFHRKLLWFLQRTHTHTNIKWEKIIISRQKNAKCAESDKMLVATMYHQARLNIQIRTSYDQREHRMPKVQLQQLHKIDGIAVVNPCTRWEKNEWKIYAIIKQTSFPINSWIGA